MSYIKADNPFEQKHFDYLEELRQSGATDMYGAAPYLVEAYPEDFTDIKEKRGLKRKGRGVRIEVDGSPRRSEAHPWTSPLVAAKENEPMLTPQQARERARELLRLVYIPDNSRPFITEHIAIALLEAQRDAFAEAEQAVDKAVKGE